MQIKRNRKKLGRKQQRKPKLVLSTNKKVLACKDLVWCRRPDSNRHTRKGGGFWQSLGLYHHLQLYLLRVGRFFTSALLLANSCNLSRFATAQVVSEPFHSVDLAADYLFPNFPAIHPIFILSLPTSGTHYFFLNLTAFRRLPLKVYPLRLPISPLRHQEPKFTSLHLFIYCFQLNQK